MKDFNVLSYVGRSLWAITDDKWAEMLPALIRHAKGDRLSAEELQAFAGKNEEPTVSKRGIVAIIPVRGVIANRMGAMDDTSGGTSCERIAAMIDQAVAGGASTIVYAFDTPGGTVAGVMELAAKMFGLRGKVKQIAQIEGVCCSAGIWLASQCDEINCTPSGEAGSIGVFAVHKDLSEALAKAGINISVIKAGKYKAEGNPFEKLTDEAREIMQGRVNEAYAQFVKDYARGRGVSVSDVKNGHGEGRSLPAKSAKAAGIVDRIATMDETLARIVGKARSTGAMSAEDAREVLHATDAEVTDLINKAREYVEETAGRTFATPIDEPAPPAVDPDAAIRERLERI